MADWIVTLDYRIMLTCGHCCLWCGVLKKKKVPPQFDLSVNIGHFHNGIVHEYRTALLQTYPTCLFHFPFTVCSVRKDAVALGASGPKRYWLTVVPTTRKLEFLVSCVCVVVLSVL